MLFPKHDQKPNDILHRQLTISLVPVTEMVVIPKSLKDHGSDCGLQIYHWLDQ